jgi:hypothetical protein
MQAYCFFGFGLGAFPETLLFPAMFVSRQVELTASMDESCDNR